MNINLNAEDIPEGWEVDDTESGSTQISVPAPNNKLWGSALIFWDRGMFCIFPNYTFTQVDKNRAGWRRTLTRSAVDALRERVNFMRGPSQ